VPAAALAVALPWPTFATGILAAAWLIVALLALEKRNRLIAIRRRRSDRQRPAGPWA